ncbi:MAG: protein kinase [Acidobacteria bacterium]|nr:protein kinase [Acidobacteriota bacterium]
MDRAREDEILQKAVAKGLVHPEGLALLEREQNRYGHRLGSLLGVGGLDADAVRQIEAELDSEAARLDRTAAVGSATTEPASSADTHFVAGPLARSLGTLTGSRCGDYQIGHLLGQGGMGEVYRAYDPLLRRSVAIKFLYGDDPRLAGRFLQEARLQARVEHENVCRVFEAGELDGRPYIVMQLIEGRTLTDAAAEMSLREKARVMADVARGVHAAHTLGLIHRDLKPGNIMVERVPGSGWKPYVMDFGLARELGGPSMTTTGHTLGTPAYMAPEQAQGQRDLMDSRTDVYGLGATLYHVLIGWPPFDGPSGVEIMIKLIRDDPPPPRDVDRTLPLDLDTIVLKCLEKDRSRRYDSAQQVAEELMRFLDGEPIFARRASWTYRTMKKVRKHRAIVIVSTAALIVLAVVGVVALRAQWRAAEETRIAQVFGQEVAGIQAIMREAYLLPLHDTRREKAIVSRMMESIGERMRRLGDIANGPGHYALGRGEIALGRHESARQHLEQAWEHGFQTADVASALGLALGALYSDQLDSARRIQGEAERAARIRQLEQSLRDPAVAYLTKGGGREGPSGVYVAGLVALYEKRYEEALRSASLSFAEMPAMYEAKILEGDVHVARARELRDRGDGEALAEFGLAETAYAAASRLGESDPRLHECVAGLWSEMLEMDLYGRTGDQSAHLTSALQACDAALAADPDRPEAHLRRSEIHWRLGEYQKGHGEDPIEALTLAAESAREAIRLRPTYLEAFLYLGNSLLMRAEYEVTRGLDFQASLESAAEAYRKAIQLDSNSVEGHTNLGLVYQDRAFYEISRGQDPLASIAKSARLLKKGAEMSPESAHANLNLGNTYLAQAQYEHEHGMDPTRALDDAERSYERAKSLNPTFHVAHNNLCNTNMGRGMYALSIGGDPRPAFDEGVASCEEALRINSDNAMPHSNLSQIFRLRGEYESLARLPCDASFARAIDECAAELSFDPTDPTALDDAAITRIYRARSRLRDGRSPTTDLEEALRLIATAIAVDPTMILAHQHLALAEILRARWLLLRGQTPEVPLRRAQSALDALLAGNPGDAPTYLVCALLNLTSAQWRLGRSTPPVDEIKTGREMAARALAINPRLAEALAVDASLSVMEARVTRDPASRLSVLTRARDGFDRAFAMNPLLDRDYGALRREATAGTGSGEQPSPVSPRP